MKKIILLSTFLFLVLFANSQIRVEAYGYIVEGKINDNDTTLHVNLKEVIVFAPQKFKNKRQKRKYYRLVRNLKKVYPYAKLANLKLKEIETHLGTLDTEIARKKYIKSADKQLRDEFEDELVKLTITQGRLLIKLIDRETGNTTYHLVKELKGNFSAFLWQSLARLFGENLKDDFEEEGEDKLIDQILIMIDNGQL
ncbi:MAG: DUF4294 domain-containing protein [Chlorobi bacterium]|nr:DUF4294 domain-containing protein [Chlorobiota bacterium]